MQKSEQIGQLVAALAKAAAEFKTIGKDKTAKIQSQKGAFSYTYADFATVINATGPALAKNGLTVLQPVRLGEGQIIVTTMLAHGSGEWISEEMSWPVASSDNRSIGSGITYARRHSYLAIIGAASTDEDDDAEQARGGAHDTTAATSTADKVKAKVAAQSAPLPIDAYKTEALKEAIALHNGNIEEAKRWLCQVRADPGAKRPWNEADVEKVKQALVLKRAKSNVEAAIDEFGLN